MNRMSHLTKRQREELEILRLFNEKEKNQGEAQVSDEFASLYEQSINDNEVKAGDVVKGIILEVQSDYVLVDINYKSEGLIPIGEFHLSRGSNEIKKGDQIEVYVDKIENENGMVVLSKEKADMMKAWADISKAAESQETVEGKVIAKVKGGLNVDIGVKAFLPGSQIDIRPVRNMDIYVGKTYKFKIIKFNKKRGNIVLSRRVLLEEERDSLKDQAQSAIKEGHRIKGLVKNITDYGAFIDCGGMDGLLHITDMSWSRIRHPSEIMDVGDEIDVIVLKYDPDKNRVSLGLKQLTKDPWLDTAGKFPVGEKLKGRVVSLADYGAFIDLGDGVEGLIHISEMSWVKRVKHPSQILNDGDEVQVLVLDIDQENRRISLGMKQLQPNPWNALKTAYPAGTVIRGKIKSVTDFGVFVGVEEDIDGMVHISDFSWTKRVKHPSDLYKKGDEISAVVLGVDVNNERFSLGIKQLSQDPWSQVDEKFTIGSIHEVKVVKVTDFGVFVELGDQIEGLVHISELASKRVNSPDEVCKKGDLVRAEVISIDRDTRRVGLSVRLASLREQSGELSEYNKGVKKAKATFGDLLADQLKKEEKPATKTEENEPKNELKEDKKDQQEKTFDEPKKTFEPVESSSEEKEDGIHVKKTKEDSSAKEDSPEEDESAR